MTEDDEIYLEYEPVTNAPVLSISGRLDEGGIYNGAISGVNTDAQNYNVSVMVNDTVVCAFVIQGRPTEVPKLTIDETSKEVEVTSEFGGQLVVRTTGTEALVSTFDIVGENINIENIDYNDEEDYTYTMTLDDTTFEGVENGTYSLTLKANMTDNTTLTDTFTLTLNITGPEPPIDPEQ